MTEPEAVPLPADEPDKSPLPVVFQSDPTRVLGYACPICSIFYSNATFGGAEGAGEQAATQCCQRACLQCATRLEKKWHYIYCKPCLGVREAEKAAKRLAAATKVPEAEYDGPVFCESNEEYYSTVGDLRDGFDADELPTEIWACTIHTLKLHADRILENAMDDHHEGAADALGTDGAAEATLQGLLDGWIETYAKDVITWNPDHKRLIVLTPEPPDEVTSPKHPVG